MDNFWTPYIEVETNSGVREVTLATKHFAKRKVFLIGEINTESVNRLVSQLLYLCQDSQEEIDLYINSGGGEVNAGLILYDVIQSMKAPLNIYCMGMAASMAAVILAGGQKGRRFILPHSKTMIHEPLIRNGVGGSATSIRNLSDSILETRELVNSLLAKHTGKTLEEINEATAYDNYMNAQESVEFGICDEIKNIM
ncbi:MAG: ATP-dependent Clp protease proteolytic subunit [Lachnospiraceae bacterium]|nr:ATP-dependent Clp protease proteolytic subunit [Lachnospiraceae bacterium]